MYWSINGKEDTLGCSSQGFVAEKGEESSS